MAMIEKTECYCVMSVIKGEAMFSLHSNYTLFTKHKMCIHLHKSGFKIISTEKLLGRCDLENVNCHAIDIERE